MKPYLWDIVISFFLVVFSVGIWLPSRYYPLFWDSTYVVNTARGIADSGFTNFASNQLGYAHATLYATLLAVIWHFFGYSTVVSHLLTLPFLPLLLISTYLLIKNQTNRELGLLGAMLVAFTPTVLAEYMNVYVDLPTAALVVLSAVLWQRHYRTAWMAAFAAAILTKVTALIAVPYFMYRAFFEKKDRLLACLYPVGISVAWFIYHFSVTGWWFNKRSNTQHLALFDGLPTIITSWFQVLLNLLFGQGRWLPCLVFIGIAVIVWITRHKNQSNIWLRGVLPAVIMVGGGSLFFAVTGEFSYRYAILIYPFFFLAICSAVYQIGLQYKSLTMPLYGALICSLIVLGTLWHPKEAPLTTTRFAPPVDLGVIDYIYIFKWLGYYAQVNNTDNTAYYGAFPENNAFLEPRMGYVKQPLNFEPCDNFAPDDTKRQIVIFHPFSPSQLACYNLVKNGAFTELGGIEKNGKWIDLYVASASGATKTQP